MKNEIEFERIDLDELYEKTDIDEWDKVAQHRKYDYFMTAFFLYF